MIVKGSRVKVTDAYAGSLDNVKGRMGKITAVNVENGKVSYLLDIRGERSYTSNYPVIVTDSEIEEAPYNFKDMEGNTVELGDIVAYGVHGGGLIKGTVVDFKDTVYPRWGTERKELKMKVEYDVNYHESDGDDRKIPANFKRSVWLSSQSSTLIIQKNPARQFFLSKDLIIHDV